MLIISFANRLFLWDTEIHFKSWRLNLVIITKADIIADVLSITGFLKALAVFIKAKQIKY